MPFKCELTLGDSITPDEELEFIGWLPGAWNSKSEWGKIVDADTAYAIVKHNGIKRKVYTTFRVALMQQGELSPGDKIDRHTVLAVVAAEGDEIAYGKPYSIFR